MKGYEVGAHLFWNQTCELAAIYMSEKLEVNAGEAKTNLNTSRCHVELPCKICAHDAVWFLVMGEGLFKDL